MAGPAGTRWAACHIRSTVGPSSQAISQPRRYTPPLNQPSVQRTSTAPAARPQWVHRVSASATASRLRLDIGITTASPRHPARAEASPKPTAWHSLASSQPGTHRQHYQRHPRAGTSTHQEPGGPEQQHPNPPAALTGPGSSNQRRGPDRLTRDAVRLRRDCSPGMQRPRLRRRGRDPAPVRGPAVVAASRRIPRRSPSASRTLRVPPGPPAAVLDPAARVAGRGHTPPPGGATARRPAATLLVLIPPECASSSSGAEVTEGGATV
jgi:hypothetical protein